MASKPYRTRAPRGPWHSNLTELSLCSNKIDDSSVILFANAITPDKNGKAALASLKELSLCHNRIDDAGLASLAEACAKGADVARDNASPGE